MPYIRSEYEREEKTAGERNIPVSGNKLFPTEEKNQIIMGKKKSILGGSQEYV